MSKVTGESMARKIQKQLPKGAKLISMGQSEERIVIGLSKFLAWEYVYEYNGQQFKSKIKAHKI